MKKKILIFVVALIFCCSTFRSYANPMDNLLYETTERSMVSSGVVYEKWERLTQAGWVDVHILEVDLSNPYVELDVIRPEAFGTKDTLMSIGADNGIVAGINGDFFSMKDNPTDVLGLEFSQGEILSVKNNINSGYGLLGTLFITDDNKPMIDFINMTFKLMSKEERPLYLSGINRLYNVENPAIYYPNAFSNTEALDKLYPNELYKIVVRNNCVTYVSQLGETVDIPKDGFVVTVRNEIAPYHLSHFPVGMEVSLDQHADVDLEHIKTAISGAGKIIENGLFIPKKGMLILENQRHPRSAVGYSKDQKTLYAVVVDGRGSSIGVTHQELGNILLDIGCYEAMHLDGGGSSTLVGKTLGFNHVQVLNTLPYGAQRKIPNGLGIISTAPKGTLKQIEIIADTTHVFKNMPIEFKVIGYDEYYNYVHIQEDAIAWQTSNLNGHWDKNTFYPHDEGTGVITCYIGGVKASIEISCMNNPIHLEFEKPYIYLNQGETAHFKVLGVNEEGVRGEINVKDILWTSHNKDIGTFIDGKFVAGSENGYTLVSGAVGGTKVYGYVIVGHSSTVIDEFEDAAVEAIASDETIQTSVALLNSEVTDGKGIGLIYQFPESAGTQAAYIKFTSPYSIDESVDGLGLWVKGNDSHHWLRGIVKDNKGKSHYITFASEIDWEGWSFVQAVLPKNVEYPIQLDRIYAASLVNTHPSTHELVIEQLTALKTIDKNELPLPKDKDYYDAMYKKTSSDTGFNVSVFGSTSGKNSILDDIILREVEERMNTISDVNVFAGQTDLSGTTLNPSAIVWQNQYSITDYDQVRVMTLATSNKGLRATDPEQWKRLEDDLNHTQQKNILIIMDRNPLKGFSDEREGQLFHDVLKTLRDKTDKNIFVVNGSGYNFNLDNVEGIRYFDINGLWYQMDENDNLHLHETFYLINFNFEQEVTFNVIDLYPKITIE